MFETTADQFFITAGNAEGFTELNAFDHALLSAGIGDVNLIKLSSILPPQAKQVERFTLPYGQLIPVAYASITSEKPGEIIAAAVSIGIPEDDSFPGLIMEYHGVTTKKIAESRAIEMAEAGLIHRGRKIKNILVQASEHKVEHCGCAFAAVVLWWSHFRK